jgi:hypothetical protein
LTELPGTQRKEAARMIGHYFLAPTLIAILFSFLIVRAASIVLIMTGLEPRKARFQSLSAFTGTGFTTREAETVVHHPVRRRIVSWLMILGNAGIVTVIVTATSSFATTSGFHIPINILILCLGVFLIYKLVGSRRVMAKWDRLIEKRFHRFRFYEEEEEPEELLHFMEGYGLVRKSVKQDSPLAGLTLSEAKICRDEKCVILGIERKKGWVPVPTAEEKLTPGDKLVVYGPLWVLRSI